MVLAQIMAVSSVQSSQSVSSSYSKGGLKERLVEAIRSRWSWLGWGYGDLQAEIAGLSPQKLNELLRAVVLDIEPEEIESLGQWFSLEALENGARVSHPEHQNALATAQQMLKQAQYYLEVTKGPGDPSLYDRLKSIVDSLIGVLETFLAAFGIAEFFRPPENSVEAEFKGQKIMMLLSLFTMVSTLLLPLLDPVTGAAIIGGTFLTIAALSLVFPYLKPIAARLPRMVNWS